MPIMIFSPVSNFGDQSLGSHVIQGKVQSCLLLHNLDLALSKCSVQSVLMTIYQDGPKGLVGYKIG